MIVAVALILLAGATLPAEARRGDSATPESRSHRLDGGASYSRAAEEVLPPKGDEGEPAPGPEEGEPPKPPPEPGGGGPDAETPDPPRGPAGLPGGEAPANGAGSGATPTNGAAGDPAGAPVQTGAQGERGDLAARRRAARRRAAARGTADARARSGGGAASRASGSSAAATTGGADPATAGDRTRSDTGKADPEPQSDGPVVRTVREVVDRVPDGLKVALALLAVLSLVLGAGYLLAAMRARRLTRQRRELLQEVGLLQAALLPPVPETLGAVSASVAYRPADGPGAGGDFYDALTLPGGRAAFILGDVSGHGRAALAHTAFMRYTLRAYLEAGLEPRMALQVAERAVGGQLDGDFATVIVAVHDPADGSLTYASAGHPAPIVAGAAKHDPVPVAWSPPIGWGLPTGMRQTTVPLPSGAIACLYTDGLADALTPNGALGREGLTEIVAECGREASAQQVVDAVAQRAVKVRDDMAACLIAPVRSVSAGASRTELLEVTPAEADDGLVAQFLRGCHIEEPEIAPAEAEAARIAPDNGGAIVLVRFGIRGGRVEVLPRNVESIQAVALQRSSAARR